MKAADAAPGTPQPPPGSRRASGGHRLAGRGLTLMELVIALAVIAILATSAAPSLAAMVARHRVKAAADTLAAHLAEARFEAVRRGLPVHLSFRGQGDTWCYALATAPNLDCQVTQASALRVVHSRSHPGVALADSRNTGFDPRGGVLLNPGGAQFASVRGDLLQVRLTPLGRASVCAPERAVGSVSPCQVIHPG